VKQVTVKKEELLETLRTNREEHAAQYAEAVGKHADALIERLLEMLAEARIAKDRPGKEVDQHVNLPVPVNYDHEYATAIQMVDWEISDVITLDAREFQRYVLNQWEWKDHFLAATASYLG
jgi:hypothetical protein